jgi:hypothetical protein
LVVSEVRTGGIFRDSHKASKAIRQARDAGRIEDAKEALRGHERERRKKTKKTA